MIAATQDPRLAPAYTAHEISKYLRLSEGTVRNWMLRDEPITLLPDSPDPGRHYLGFFNLVEMHAFASLREFGLSLQRIRKAIRALRSTELVGDLAYPFASQQLLTDGQSIFLQHLGELVDLTEGRQMAMKKILDRFLKRVRFDPEGLAEKFFPFTRTSLGERPNEPHLVSIDPRVSFGSPCINETGIRTAVLYDMYMAGNTIGEIATAYDRSEEEVEEAIRCEAAAAA